MGRKTLSLPRVIHHAPEGSEDFAQRIDSAFAELEGFLRNSDTKELAEEASQRSRNLFYQTFEDDIFPSWTVVFGDPANEVTYPTNGQAGGKALRHDADGTDLWSVFPENIPFDPDRLYRIRCRARLVTAPSDASRDNFYCGVEGVASDGETLVNSNGVDGHGSQHYFAASGEDMGAFTLGEWQTFTGYFKGVAASGNGDESRDPSAPGTVHEDVRYIRPLFILNYNDGDGKMEIDYIVVEALTEDPEIELGKAAGQVDETRIEDDSISTPKLQANSVIATKIDVVDLEAVSAQMGTLVAGKILSGKIEISADDEHILLGDATAPLTGTGIFQGLSGGVYQFRAGDPGGAHVIWDGTDLKIAGALVTENLEFDSLTLNPGPLIVGSDPGGSEILRVGGAGRFSSVPNVGGTDLLQRDQNETVTGAWTFSGTPVIVGTDPGGSGLLRVGGNAVIGDAQPPANWDLFITGSSTAQLAWYKADEGVNEKTWLADVTGGDLRFLSRNDNASGKNQNLRLMADGSVLVGGSDPGGSELLRVGGGIVANGDVNFNDGGGLIIPVGTWPS